MRKTNNHMTMYLCKLFVPREKLTFSENSITNFDPKNRKSGVLPVRSWGELFFQNIWKQFVIICWRVNRAVCIVLHCYVEKCFTGWITSSFSVTYEHSTHTFQIHHYDSRSGSESSNRSTQGLASSNYGRTTRTLTVNGLAHSAYHKTRLSYYRAIGLSNHRWYSATWVWIFNPRFYRRMKKNVQEVTESPLRLFFLKRTMLLTRWNHFDRKSSYRSDDSRILSNLRDKCWRPVTNNVWGFDWASCLKLYYRSCLS